MLRAVGRTVCEINPASSLFMIISQAVVSMMCFPLAGIPVVSDRACVCEQHNARWTLQKNVPTMMVTSSTASMFKN